jgi:addiction module HigA family antidote
MLAPDAKLIHPGTVLRDRVLPGLGLSVLQAARELHICRQTLHRILAGRAAVTAGMAARLSRLSGVPARFWLDLQQAHDLAQAEANLSGMLPRIPAHALPPALMKELTAYAHSR